MPNIVWTVILAIPPLVLMKLDVPKWIVLLSAVPFALYSVMKNHDPEEGLFGESSGTVAKVILALLAIGGLIVGPVIWNVFLKGR